MKGELKAGGLALVIKSTDAEYVGKCVTLIQLVLAGDYFTSPQGQFCRNRECNGNIWLVSGDFFIQENGHTVEGWAVFSPEHLMPIDGEPDQLTKDKPAELTA